MTAGQANVGWLHGMTANFFWWKRTLCSSEKNKVFQAKIVSYNY